MCWQMHAAMDFNAMNFGPKGLYTHETVRLPAALKTASPACMKWRMIEAGMTLEFIIGGILLLRDIALLDGIFYQIRGFFHSKLSNDVGAVIVDCVNANTQ